MDGTHLESHRDVHPPLQVTLTKDFKTFHLSYVIFLP